MDNDAKKRRLEEIKALKPDNTMPYTDPAIINPEELASYPPKAKILGEAELAKENEDHMVNKRTPVREGRNIVRTDNNPDTDGFM